MNHIVLNLKKIETLQICNNTKMINEFTEVSHLKDLKYLKKLDLSCTDIDDNRFFQIINYLPNLYHLRLNRKFLSKNFSM